MKKLAIFSSLAALTLVAAAPPSQWSKSAIKTIKGYPPCSATVRDRCIQLYERGMATAANLALNERLGRDRVGVGLAAARPMQQPSAPPQDYAYADIDDEPLDQRYDMMDEEWDDHDDYAAYYPEDDDAYYGGGM